MKRAADDLLPHLLSTGNYAGVCTQYVGHGGGGGTGKVCFPWRPIPGGGPSGKAVESGSQITLSGTESTPSQRAWNRAPGLP